MAQFLVSESNLGPPNQNFSLELCQLSDTDEINQISLQNFNFNEIDNLPQNILNSKILQLRLV